MRKKKWTNEFKVGFFVIFCVLGFLYMMYSTGKLDIKSDKGYFVSVVFEESAGLEPKAPVMLNGLEVGKVDEITPSYKDGKTQITLKLWLENQAKIREGSKISIKMMGLMGEKYIQIMSSDNSNFVSSGAILKGEDYIDLDVFIRNLNAIAEENKENINMAIKNFDSLLANLNDTISDNQEGLRQTIKNFEETSQNFEEFSDDLKRNPWKILFKTKDVPPDPKKK
ncbi:MAG: MlaD family protein [Candidatus Omnitrophica bacterium]|nr:MlaD family protein [Candidatus Omnitrophota bacterium]